VKNQEPGGQSAGLLDVAFCELLRFPPPPRFARSPAPLRFAGADEPSKHLAPRQPARDQPVGREIGDDLAAVVGVATGATIPEVETEIREAIRFHIDGLKADGVAVPAPTSIAEYVEA